MTMFMFLTIVFISLIGTVTEGGNRVNVYRIKGLIDKLFIDAAMSNSFNSLYENAIYYGPYELKSLNATHELHSYAHKLGWFIQQMKMNLQNAVAWTEEEISKYPWNPHLSSDNVKYIKLEDLKEDDEELELLPEYPIKVLPNRSGVHFPVEVYIGDPAIFHPVLWSNALDYIFKKIDALRFIYFASVSGIFRMFPAFSWKPASVDMFDVRRRGWYAQSSQVPKHLFVMIDTSGSMTGQSLSLANISAQKLVGILHEDDYFAVGQFPKTDTHLSFGMVTPNLSRTPCFESFVRATKRNKLRLSHEMYNLTAKGNASFAKAFAEAINLFNLFWNKSREDRTDQPCNRILVVLTDDAFQFDAATNKALTEKPDDIRLFIYAFGDPVGNVNTYIKEACKFRGHYKYLPTVGALSNMLTHYHAQTTRIFSGPDGGPILPDLIMHGVSDVFQIPNYEGTGLMVSLSMPVYNRTAGDPEFVGVMGTDLPIEQMIAELPMHKLGPLGYAFAVDPNGNVLFHPTLKWRVRDLDDPPVLDWLDLEFNEEGEKTEFRRKLVDGDEASQTITEYIKVNDSVHVHRVSREYISTNIPNTKFGLAFVTPTITQSYLGSDQKVDMKLSRSSNGVYRINKVKLNKLLTNARVFLPSDCIELLISTARMFDPINPPENVDTLFTTITTTPVPTTTEIVLSVEDFNETEWNSTADFNSTNETVTLIDLPLVRLFKRDVADIFEYTTRTTSMESVIDCTNDTFCNDTNEMNFTETMVPDNSTKEEPFVPMEEEQEEEDDDDSPLNQTPTNNVIIFLNQIYEKVTYQSDLLSQILFDLTVAEKDLSKQDLASTLEYPVRSRTISLNSGVSWTVPANSSEEFGDELTQWPLSPIYQRVYDSPNLLFWIKLVHGVAEPLPIPTSIDESELTDNSSELFDVSAAYEEFNESTASIETNSTQSVDEATEPTPVTVFKAITIGNEPKSYKAGIIGITLESDFLPNELRSMPECSEESGKICYMIEDAANVVAVNNEVLQGHVGRFLGYVDPPLMHMLLENHVYDSIVDYNFQAVCISKQADEEEQTSAGDTIRITQWSHFRQMLLFSVFNPWTTSSWLVSKETQGCYGSQLFMLSFLLPLGIVGGEVNHEPYGCIHKLYRYFPYIEMTNSSDDSPRVSPFVQLNGKFVCIENCSREWSVVDVEGTNLKILTADPPCQKCSGLDNLVPRDAVEDNGPDVCEQSRNPRYRRLVNRCTLDEEKKPVCMSSCHSSSIITSTILLLLRSLF